MDQPARTAALDQFRRGEVALLIASDVAARGLDIPGRQPVFNFDVPHHADDYVHRIGRTGRAGLSGTAITVVSPADKKSVAAIEKLIGQTIGWMSEPPAAAFSAEPRPVPTPSAHRTAHRNGRKPPRKQDRPATVARLEERAASPGPNRRPTPARSCRRCRTPPGIPAAAGSCQGLSRASIGRL